MIAVDTPLLVHAHRRDSPFHEPARDAVKALAEDAAPWAIPWPCVHEFYAIVTHARIWRPPSTPTQAIAQLDAWLSSPSLRLLGESVGYWPTLRELVRAGKVAGAAVHDARVAAICLDAGVRELWTADRDFARFPRLTTRNPLVG